MQVNSEPGSYKDPSGAIFYYNDKIYRWVSSGVSQFYQNLVAGAFFQNLVHSNFIVPTWPVDLSDEPQVVKAYGDKVAYFEHERLDFISFPHEWPFAMLIDAALHILELQYQLLKNNLSLKDATPYNIQFRNTRPLFIDLCSIENISHNGIWIAYNQFCQTLLYPLLNFSLNLTDPRGIYLTRMNGLTLKESVQTIGFRPFFRYGMIFDYLIPAIIVKLGTHKIIDITKKDLVIDKTLSNSANLQLHTVRRLKKAIKKIDLKTGSNDWQKYRQKCSYADEDYAIKKAFIENFLKTSNVKKVIDLGCNLGDFSILAAKKGCHVTAVDSDHDCVNSLYLLSKQNEYRILHLWMDITNPSPSIGWQNTERPDFLSRYKGRFDCVFALALIHHLMITNRIPLAEIASLFRKLTSRYLLIEYIGPADSMFCELLKYRNEDYSDFNMKHFEETMSTQFTTLNKSKLIDRQRQMERCLYLMECKN